MLAGLLIVSRMASPAIAIYQNAEVIATMLPAYVEINQIGKELGSLKESEPAAAVDLSGPIRLQGATYLHADGGGVRDVNLVISPGEIVGVVGPSGSARQP